jgi:hypothetical protein
MMRIELMEQRDGNLHTVGMYELVSNNYFELTDLDTAPMLTNPYRLAFPISPRHEDIVLTHIGFFPALEYTGVVTELTAPLTVKEGMQVGFNAGSITLSMDTGSLTTVIKGAA